MSQSARVQEPSMEEILASIRRIIADDTPDAVKDAQAQTAKPVAARPSAPPSADEQPAMSQQDIDAMLADQASDDGILELGEPAPSAAPKGFRHVPASDVMFREEHPAEPQLPAQYPQSAGPDTLLSPTTNAAVSAAFGSLASTMLSENARTLEDLVKEMLKPMLKAWLDDNLPGLVERMVRAEIERVARGGR